MAKAQNYIEIEESRADFIPYACHFDAETILTKNGELLQTIKIEGYQFDVFVDGKKLDIRALVREAFLENALHPHIAAHFHIIRRPRDLSPNNTQSGYFANNVNAAWEKKYNWQHSYSNDLYITLIHEGTNFNLKNIAQVTRSFLFLPERSAQHKHLIKAKEKLQAITDQIIKKLAPLHPKKLQSVEKNGVFYSEQLSLLHNLTNLETGRDIAMPISDISDYLCSNEISFDFYSLRSKNAAGAERFAAIYSFKQYHEMKPAMLDALLQFQGEFVISHQVMLGADQAFIESLEHKRRMAEMGEDKELIAFSGIEDLLNNNRGQWSDYANQQSTIMLLSNSEAELAAKCDAFVKALGTIGVSAIREDLMLEHIYYSQMPANFLFVKRANPINTNHIAGFSSLYSFPAGKLTGNHWGDSLTTLKTKEGNPYFFSFHNGKNGNTLIAGPFGSKKTELLNFMMTQAESAAPRVIWFDTYRKGEMLIRALGGGYMQLVRNRETPRRLMNPLQLPDTPENRTFLAGWLKNLLLDLDGKMKSDEPIPFEQIVMAIYALPKEKRMLSNLSFTLPETLAVYFAQWVGTGRYGHLFDNAIDETFIGRRIEGFDLTEMVQDRRPHWAVFDYLMHCALQTLDGKPTIFVFDEAWKLFDNSVFSAKIMPWLDAISARNGMVIFATDNMDDIPQSTLTAVILQRTATRMLFTHRETIMPLKKLLGLDDEQFKQYAGIAVESDEVFLQKGTESVVLNMQLPQVSGIMQIMSGSPVHVTRMENTIAKAGTLPEQWLPEFYKQLTT